MSLSAVKLKKVETNLWLAADTLYLKNIQIKKSHGTNYRITAENTHLGITVCDLVEKQAGVKAWIANYDEEHNQYIAQKKAKEEKREQERQARYEAIRNGHNEYCLTKLQKNIEIGETITARFAALSKCSTIGEYYYESAKPESDEKRAYRDYSDTEGWRYVTPKNWYIQKVEIVKICNITTEEYDHLASNLFDKEAHKIAGITSECGGVKSSYIIDENKYPDGSFMLNASRDEYKAFQNESWIVGALVTAPDRRPFISNTEGREYTSSVGLFI